MSKSIKREGIFGGEYTEHFDDQGNKIGTSKEHEGIFGDKYTEHLNGDGERIGVSKEMDGFFEDYTEHSNRYGEKTGESIEREGIWGDKYTEHTNHYGEKIGESRRVEGLFGDYVEHTGAGWRSEDYNSKTSSSTGSSYGNDSSHIMLAVISILITGGAYLILKYVHLPNNGEVFVAAVGLIAGLIALRYIFLITVVILLILGAVSLLLYALNTVTSASLKKTPTTQEHKSIENYKYNNKIIYGKEFNKNEIHENNTTGNDIINKKLIEGISFYDEGKYLKAIEKFDYVLMQDNNNSQAIRYKMLAQRNLEKLNKDFVNPVVGKSR